MVALDHVEHAASGRRWSVPASLAGAPLGLIAGLGLVLNFEIAVLTSLLTLACVTRRTGAGAVAAWGAAYVLTTGIWVLPAAHSALAVAVILFGLPLAGAVFYGAPLLLLMTGLRLPFAFAYAVSLTLAELIALAFGFSLAPIGFTALGSGGEWLIAGVGVYGTTAIIALVCAYLSTFELRGFIAVLPLALAAMIAPGVERPAYSGPSVHAVTHNPDPITKWTPTGAALAFDALITRSGDVDADLRVWPENAVTNTLRIDRAIEQIPSDVRPVLFGMTYLDAETGEMRNGAIYVGRNGDAQVSNKEHLVPLFETARWPTRGATLIAGSRTPIVLDDGSRILALICYEAAFPIPAKAHERVSALFVLAAESGFWQPVGSAMMARHMRAREIETGLPVIKVSDIAVDDQMEQGAW